LRMYADILGCYSQAKNHVSSTTRLDGLTLLTFSPHSQ
jgi:hypothetical protein